MADYIYLLQNRLTPAQRRALEAVRDVARAHAMPVFLAGGAVRDLTSGAPVRDLDFAVQGDPGPLLADLQGGGAVVAGENAVLAATYLVFPGGVRAELGPTLTITYPKPGQPETQPTVILDDLRRRDFTANSMAISLNEGSYGLLLDPLNGVADIENRELRLVSNYGFIEQPALLLRIARLSDRLGWSLEERTQTRYETAKEENYIAALPARDRGYELEEIFHEEDPLGALEHLNAEGWGEVLFPALSPAKADTEGIERVRDLMGQMERLGIHTDPSPVLFPLITAKLPAKDLAELKELLVRPGFVQQIDSLESRSKDLSAQMTGKSAAAPSELWKLLFVAEPEVVLWTAYSSRSSAVQVKLKAFLNDWPQMRQRIPYALMQEMRITPDLPGYEQLLEDLFFALMDGKLSTPEATRAFLEPFSPPAPAPQAAPRRRAAKTTRSRAKKGAAAAAAAAESAEAEDDTSPDSEQEDEPSAEVSAPAPSPKAAKGASAKSASSAPSEAVAARKGAANHVPAAPVAEPGPSVPAKKTPQKAVAKTSTPPPAAKASAKVAVPEKKAAVGVKSSAKWATAATKTAAKVSPAAAKAKASPASAKAKTPPAAAKKAVPATKLSQKPVSGKKVLASASGKNAAGKSAAKAAKSSGRGAAPARESNGSKGAASKKAAAKKQAPPARSGAKLSSVTKASGAHNSNAHKTTAKEHRS